MSIGCTARESTAIRQRNRPRVRRVLQNPAPELLSPPEYGSVKKLSIVPLHRSRDRLSSKRVRRWIGDRWSSARQQKGQLLIKCAFLSSTSCKQDSTIPVAALLPSSKIWFRHGEQFAQAVDLPLTVNGIGFRASPNPLVILIVPGQAVNDR